MSGSTGLLFPQAFLKNVAGHSQMNCLGFSHTGSQDFLVVRFLSIWSTYNWSWMFGEIQNLHAAIGFCNLLQSIARQVVRMIVR